MPVTGRVRFFVISTHSLALNRCYGRIIARITDQRYPPDGLVRLVIVAHDASRQRSSLHPPSARIVCHDIMSGRKPALAYASTAVISVYPAPWIAATIASRLTSAEVSTTTSLLDGLASTLLTP